MILSNKIATAIGLAPQTLSSDTAVSGSSIDRKEFGSLAVAFTTGASGGSAAMSFSLAFKLEHSADDAAWAAVSGATATITAQNTISEIGQDLEALNRYVRVVVTPTFTGAGSPTVLVGATVIKGDAKYEPI